MAITIGRPNRLGHTIKRHWWPTERSSSGRIKNAFASRKSIVKAMTMLAAPPPQLPRWQSPPKYHYPRRTTRKLHVPPNNPFRTIWRRPQQQLLPPPPPQQHPQFIRMMLRKIAVIVTNAKPFAKKAYSIMMYAVACQKRQTNGNTWNCVHRNAVWINLNVTQNWITITTTMTATMMTKQTTTTTTKMTMMTPISETKSFASTIFTIIAMQMRTRNQHRSPIVLMVMHSAIQPYQCANIKMILICDCTEQERIWLWKGRVGERASEWNCKRNENYFSRILIFRNFINIFLKKKLMLFHGIRRWRYMLSKSHHHIVCSSFYS